MKKLLLALLILVLLQTLSFSADEWLKTQPAGTNNVSDIDSLVGENNTALDRLLANYNTIALTYDSAAQLTASVGEVVCSNSDGSVRKMRQNTTATTITWANIDTGSEATSATYYIWANCDADATDATFKISLSSTIAGLTGITSAKKIGSFYNDSSGNITNIFNLKFTSLGAYVSKTAGTTYQATTDGFVVGNTYTSNQGNKFIAYTDSSSAPTTQVQRGEAIWMSAAVGTALSFSFPVKAGDYYKVLGYNYLGVADNSQIEKLYFVPISLNGGN